MEVRSPPTCTTSRSALGPWRTTSERSQRCDAEQNGTGKWEDLDQAQQWLGQGMDVLTEIGNPGWTASALNLAAAIAAWGADEVTAAQLWGAADALVDDPSALEGADARVREEFQALARSKLGASQFAGEVDKGRRMPLDEAIRAAKDTPPMAPAQTL